VSGGTTPSQLSGTACAVAMTTSSSTNASWCAGQSEMKRDQSVGGSSALGAPACKRKAGQLLGSNANICSATAGS
jgi:hypothetical protein